MLILARRFRQALYVGDDIRVSVRDKLRFHVVVAILAPADTCVEWCGQALQPAVQPTGGTMYLLPLLSGQSFCLDEADVRVWFDTSPGTRRYRDRAVRFGISAPPALPIHREELLLRIRQEQSRPLLPSMELDDDLSPIFQDAAA